MLDLPPYKVFDGSENEIDYGHKDEYFEGMYGDEFYTDHYIDFYGADDIGYLKIVSQNGSDRNLLIIGDSFANSIEPSSIHCFHTYCIDIHQLFLTTTSRYRNFWLYCLPGRQHGAPRYEGGIARHRQ